MLQGDTHFGKNIVSCYHTRIVETVKIVEVERFKDQIFKRCWIRAILLVGKEVFPSPSLASDWW